LPGLQQQFGALLGLPAAAAIGGKADLSWKTDFRPQGSAEVALAAEAFSWKQDQTVLFDEPSLTATIKLNGDLPGGDVEIGALEIDSGVLRLNAAGSYAAAESVRRLSLNGNISARLEKLSEPLTKALKTEIVAQEAGGPFQISIAATDGKWAEAWKTMVFDAALAIERIGGYGISLKQLEVPIQVERGVASAQIAGSVNKGTVRLNPTTDLTASPAAVIFPENSVVLKSVVLTQDMISDLLAEIHPLFKGAVVGQGNIDLNLNHFYWPLEQALRDQAEFKGKLRFNDTYLTSSPLLDLLLALVKSDGRQLNLSGQELTFALRQGRIHSDPVTVTVKSHPVTLVGSMGLDNSLDYTASVPITVDLVGKAAYPLLKDAIFEVPITGTVSKPRIDMKAFKAELKSLTSQAGQQLLQEKAGDWLKKLLD
jgi:hypothetical protein